MSRHPRWSGFLERLSTALAALILGSSLGAQSSPAASTPGVAAAAVIVPKVFTACYLKLVGTTYRIKEPTLPQQCIGNTSVEFTWTDGIGAIRAGDAASGDLGGSYPSPFIAALRGSPLAATPPSAVGQVLTWNGTAWAPAASSSGGVSDHGALSGLADDDHTQYLLTDGVRQATNGFAVTGTLLSGSIPATGHGARLMWYPAKAAFRAGFANGTVWDDANVGLFSIALGGGLASGKEATAFGSLTRATGEISTAMGFDNTASGFGSTAMGSHSTASGSNTFAVGASAVASGIASLALGSEAVASGPEAVAIGPLAKASGNRGIAIGTNGTASGAFSMALGTSGSTNGFQGSFVYSDYLDPAGVPPVKASAHNQFVVRASGGTIFYSSQTTDGSAGTSGVTLAPGAGAWASVSDVRRKENFRDLDADSVLTRISRMAIREWNYRSQAAAIRHVGPTAQDFYAAFKLAGNDTTITTTDIDGVALLAIQALERRTRELTARTAQVSALETRVAELERLLTHLAGSMGSANAAPTPNR